MLRKSTKKAYFFSKNCYIIINGGDFMIKVILKRCEEYNVALIKKQVYSSLNELGGLDKFINQKSKVLLKVNLLTMKKPEQVATTHPAFVEALIEIFKEHDCEVLVADSPGGPFISTMMKRVYRVTKMKEITDKHNIELNQDFGSFQTFDNDSLIYKKMRISNYTKDVDDVMSVSKMKTHAFMTFTGAVKNMFGIIPGLAKADLRMHYPDLLDFANMLLDICKHIKPTLSFMDGIVAMEGEGPGSGDPRQMNAILTSASPYHLGVVATQMINVNPLSVPTIYNSIERGIIKEDFSDIEIVGNLKDFITHTFVPAKTNRIEKSGNLKMLKL